MMDANAYRTVATVGADHRIEIVAPQLSEGEQVEIILLPAGKPLSEGRGSIFDLLLDPNRPIQDATYWEEREREMREIRNSWDR